MTHGVRRFFSLPSLGCGTAQQGMSVTVRGSRNSRDKNSSWILRGLRLKSEVFFWANLMGWSCILSQKMDEQMEGMNLRRLANTYYFFWPQEDSPQTKQVFSKTQEARQEPAWPDILPIYLKKKAGFPGFLVMKLF